MGKATLVIMAAGIGSRFGGGIKQLEPVGPNGEIIIDYSIYDALEAGFDKVVFVIRKSLEKDFKDIIGRRIEDKVNVEYVFQEIKDIPEKYKMKFNERMKPWGTGQAILCCKNVVKEPFLVINADDYYGKEAYKKAFDYLTGCVVDKKPLTICMIGFILKNTLSNNGGVTRGVCKVSKKGKLTEIEEIPNIRKNDKGQAVAVSDDRQIDVNSVVSMNMWGLTPAFIDILESGFADFLDEIDAQDLKVEYLLPTIIGGLLEKQQIEVDVLESQDRWFGVTYKEDKEEVVEAVKLLIDSGDYDIRI